MSAGDKVRRRAGVGPRVRPVKVWSVLGEFAPRSEWTPVGNVMAGWCRILALTWPAAEDVPAWNVFGR